MVALFITEADAAEGYFLGSVVALSSLYAIWRLVRAEGGERAG
jgi:hypothetical protein